MSAPPQARPAVPGVVREPGLGRWNPSRQPASAAAVCPTPGRRGLFVAAATVAVLVFAGLAAVFTTDVVRPEVKEIVSDVALIPLAAFVVVVAAARTARRTSRGRDRRAWWLLAAAGACWTLGELAWYVNRYLSETVADPSWADLFYLAAVLPAAGALLAFSRGGTPGERLRDVLGALVVGGSVVFVSEVLTLDVVFRAADDADPLMWAVYRAYPIADIVLMTLALVVLVRVESARRASLALLAAGILAYALADMWYSYSSVLEVYEPGGGWDLGWVAGYLLMGLAALGPDTTREQPAPETTDEQAPVGPRSLAVYVPVLIAVVIAAVRPVPLDRPVLVASGVLVLVLFGVRQVALAAENVRLGRSLQARVAELENRTVELRLLGEQTERIVAAVVDGVLEVRHDGRVRFANPAAARLLARPPAALTGADESELFPVGDAETESPVATALRTGREALYASATLRRGDGTTFPAELAIGPVLDRGQVLGVVVVFSDVTERREVERMKDEFISTVSHELRTPLTSIRGSLGLLAGGAAGTLPAQASRMVAIALDSSERLTRLINDMLDIERIESGTSMMELAECDAPALLRTAVEGMGTLADLHEVALVVAPSEGRVLADEDRIVQTLTNLVGNAVKFSPPGSTVTLSAAPQGGTVRFDVRDEGRGIPPERVARVFERFEQVDSSDARQKGGTGLGLAISRSIVERHGGSIEVKSVVGEGSTFSFRLPAFRTPRTVAETAGPGQPTVLVCDDDPAACQVVATILRQRGYAVTAVPDARSAIARARANQPDVLLLDLRMPHMSGWDAVDVLQSDKRTRAIPVVVMSGITPRQDRRLSAQTQGWLEKPVTERAISRTLGSTLRGYLKRPRVLLVEDDDDLAGVLTATFEREGLHTVRAAGEHAGLALAEDLRPDAVVLDLCLADGSGLAFVETLRSSPERGAVPLVVYSGREVPPEERAALSLGRTVFLTKGRATSEQLAQHVFAMLGIVSRAAASLPTRGSEDS